MKKLEHQSSARLIKDEGRLRCLNTYYKMGMVGTSAETYTREAIYQGLLSILKKLEPGYQLCIFDAYRSLETQTYLFNQIKAQLGQDHPHLGEQKLYELTISFVSDPYHGAKFKVPPHVSGGAIDLSIAFEGELLDMGSAFDETTERSATAFFEQDYQKGVAGFSEERWLEVREHRRILHNLMISEGFTNFPSEWWHYDLGDQMWADHLGVDAIYRTPLKCD